MARVPWARPRSGFTLLFEALVVTMAAQMPVAGVGAHRRRARHPALADRQDRAQSVTRAGYSPIASSAGRAGAGPVRNFAKASQKFDLPCRNRVPWSMDHLERITLEPGRRSGKPCIRGLRITVYDVLEYLASGMTEAEILADFPDLEPEDIRASLAFAAAGERRLVSIPPQ